MKVRKVKMRLTITFTEELDEEQQNKVAEKVRLAMVKNIEGGYIKSPNESGTVRAFTITGNSTITQEWKA